MAFPKDVALIILGYVGGIPLPARYHWLMRGNTQASLFPGVSLRISPSSQHPHQSSADASSQDADDPCSSTTQDRVYIRIARLPVALEVPPSCSKSGWSCTIGRAVDMASIPLTEVSQFNVVGVGFDNRARR